MSGETSFMLQELVGQVIVLDLNSPFVCIGQLDRVATDFIVLADADVHDLRDSNKTREKYVLDGRLHGFHPNRAKAWINQREIVGISRLEDVVVD